MHKPDFFIRFGKILYPNFTLRFGNGISSDWNVSTQANTKPQLGLSKLQFDVHSLVFGCSQVFDYFVFGFPPYWVEYAEKCMGEGFASNAISTSKLGI